MDDLEAFVPKEKKAGYIDTNSKNIGHRDRTWHWNIFHCPNEEWKKINSGRNGTTKLKRIRTLGEKEYYTYLGLLEQEIDNDTNWGRIETINTRLLKTARILRRIQDTWKDLLSRSL